MRKSILTIFSLLSIVILSSYLLGACKKDQNTDGIHLLQQEISNGFPQPAYTFEDNPLSEEGFELGRKLI